MIRLLLAALLFSTCKNDYSKRHVSEINKDETQNYPRIVDSLKLNDFYDSAKFYLYIYHCNLKYEPKLNDKKDEIFLSFLDLSFDTLKIKNDTVELYYKFKDGNKIVDPYHLKRFIYLKNGVGFRISNKEKLYLTTDRNMVVTETGSSSRFVNALQPDVVTFLKMHKNKINLWLKEQVEKRGIIL